MTEDNELSKYNMNQTYYESAKCQYCATYAKTSEEVNEKFGFKQNGERYSRCRNVWIIYVYGKMNTKNNNNVKENMEK